MPHLHDKIDFTSEVFIVHQNKVLLRIHDKLGIWLSVGGHIELDEDPSQAAIREVKEEIGLDIALPKPPHNYTDPSTEITELLVPEYLVRNRINKTHEHITFVYFVKSPTNKITEPQTQEKSPQIKWFTKKELLNSNDIRENVRFYALKALEKLT